jgi:hypothetical protein
VAYDDSKRLARPKDFVEPKIAIKPPRALDEDQSQRDKREKYSDEFKDDSRRASLGPARAVFPLPRPSIVPHRGHCGLGDG